MGKVKDEFIYPVHDSVTGEQISRGYILLDVADDAEGYGVVIGDDSTDRTIAFGEDGAAFGLALSLFNSMKNEVKATLDQGGQVTEKTEYMFDKLESLYNFEDEQLSYEYMLDVIKYISIYHPQIQEVMELSEDQTLGIVDYKHS